MFEDSLLESGGRFKKQRNPWATALSFTIEIAVVALLVLVPMIYTEALPVKELGYVFGVTAPTTSAQHPPEHRAALHESRPTASNIRDGVLIVPTSMPTHARHIVDPVDADNGPGGTSGPFIPGAIPIGGPGDRFSRDFIARAAPPILAVPSVAKPMVKSEVMEGLLIRKVLPVYPDIAKKARIQGTVTLEATISRDGTIQNLVATSGHPMLVRAAVDAVRQWRYRPYLLNNQPVDVETNVTVTFTLN